MSSPLQNNITNLQELLEAVNALPEAGGVELPELTNEGTATDLLSGKELIDSEGNVVTGTFSIDSELTTQDTLIAELQSVLDGKTSGGDYSSKVISVSCPSGYSIYGFDVNGNPLEVTGGTGEFFEGIVGRQ